MGLVQCQECGRQISSDAFACPLCGKRLKTFPFFKLLGGSFAAAPLLGVTGLFLISPRADRSVNNANAAAGNRQPASHVQEVQVPIDSLPNDAEIWQASIAGAGDQLLGHTPSRLTFRLPDGQPPPTIILKKRGFGDERRSVSPDPMLFYLRPDRL
jgi:hypothetical protein